MPPGFTIINSPFQFHLNSRLYNRFQFSFYAPFVLFLGKPSWFWSVPSVLYSFSFAFLFPSDCRIMEYFQNEDLECDIDDFYNLDDFEHDDLFAWASRFQTIFFFFYLFQIFYVPHLRHQDGVEASVILAKGWKRIAYKWRRELLIANFVIARREMLTNGEGVDHATEFNTRLVKSTIVHFQDCLQMEMENAYLQLCVQECLQLDKGNAFYAFQFNTRLVKSTIVHFQLENLPISHYFSYFSIDLLFDAILIP
ncbi:hypothetical protein V6N11_025743 [Hibiscus sabdariffa]|uniref:Uncharacterized protein n=1 Tax=Hibiscus sabdariffa TaxID=183260 RepID=A0ABR2STW9_9ROSI